MTGQRHPRRWRRSIFQKTALIFMVVALIPAAIISLKTMDVFSSHLERMAEAGAISPAESTRQLHEVRAQALAYSGYGAVIALLLGYFFAASLVRPIRSLQVGARRIGDGELDVRVETDTEDELEELATTINQMADSLQEREGELRRHSRHLAILYEFAHEMSEAGGLDELLDQALEKTMEISAADCGCIFVIDEQGGLAPAVCRGRKDVYSMEVFNRAAREATRSGEPALISSKGREGDTRTVACVAVRYENTLEGAICVAGEHADFTPETMQLLVAVGSEVAIAVENRRLLKQLEKQNTELTQATNESAGLITRAEREESFSIRYENKELVRCWELKNCTRRECPSYQSENLRC